MHQILLLLFAHLPFCEGIYIEFQGPFRFALDTGAESSSIDERLAQRLRLSPQYRVEIVSAAASSLAPATRTSLRAGTQDLPDTEAILLPLSDGDGILGQSALRRLDYRIDNQSLRVELNAVPGPHAVAIPLRYVDNRIAIPAQIGSETFTLLLDSGSNALLLPHAPAQFRSLGRARATTHNGQKQLEYGSVSRLRIAGLRFQDVPLALADLPYGLLPASFFGAVTVSNSQGLLFLEPKPALHAK